MNDTWTLFRRLFVVVVALLFATGALQEDELLCEEAIAHLRDCCPSLRAPHVCGDSDGCSPVTTLTRSESECVMHLECGAETDEICSRSEDVQAALHEASRGEHEQVCP